MTEGKRLATNFFWLSVAEIASRLAAVVLSIFVYNFLGATAGGQIAFAAAFVSFFNLFADFGLSTLGIREIARDLGKTSQMGSEILAFQTWLSLYLLLVIGLLVLVLPLDGTTRLVTFLLGAGIVPAALNMSYIFVAHQRMAVIGVVRLATQLGYIAGGFLFLWLTRNVVVLPIVQLACAFGGSVGLYWLVRRQLHFRRHQVRVDRLIGLVKPALPFVAAALLAEVYHNMDVVMLQFWRGSEVVGFYTSGYKIVNIALVFGTMLGGVYFPQLAATARDKLSFADQASQFARWLGALAVPISVGGFVLAGPIIGFLYRRPEFAAGVAPFRILIFLPAIILLNVCLGNVLIAQDGQRQNLVAVAIGAGLDIALNFLFIPPWGMVGAAWATLISEMSVGLALAWALWRLGWQPGRLIGQFGLKPAIAALIMAMAIKLLPGWSILVDILIGALVYVAVALAMGAVPLSSWRPWGRVVS